MDFLGKGCTCKQGVPPTGVDVGAGRRPVEQDVDAGDVPTS